MFGQQRERRPANRAKPANIYASLLKILQSTGVGALYAPPSHAFAFY